MWTLIQMLIWRYVKVAVCCSVWNVELLRNVGGHLKAYKKILKVALPQLVGDIMKTQSPNDSQLPWLQK